MSVESFNLAIVVSHPIQHFCPQYVSLAKKEGINLKLFFASTLGYKKYLDKNFGVEVVWNNLNLDKFEHLFLNGEEVLPSDKTLSAPTLTEELDNFKPNAIITYGYFQKFQRDCHRWANNNHVPLAYISDAEKRQSRPLIKSILKKLALSIYFKKIDYFLTVGNANEEYYQSYFVPKSKFIRMHYPIDVERYNEIFIQKDIHRETIREELKIPRESFVVSVVGKLVTWKNQIHLVSLLKELVREDIDCHLIIIGTGSEEDNIKSAINELDKNIHMAGFVDPNELPKYYAASDLYIHPAMIEPHSLAISEAIYMGLPVVISNRCGSYGENDDVQEGKNGHVYEFGNINQLKEIVKKLIMNPDIISRYSSYSIEISRKFQDSSHGKFIDTLISKIERS